MATTALPCAVPPIGFKPARKPQEATGEAQVVTLRELLGLGLALMSGEKRGAEIAALGADGRIHPHYGVFSPVRGEYIDLVAQAPLPLRKSWRLILAPARAC